MTWETFDSAPLELSPDIVVGYWDAGKWWTYQPRSLAGWQDLHARNGKGMNQAYWMRLTPPPEPG